MVMGHPKGTDRADRSRGHESPRTDFQRSLKRHARTMPADRTPAASRRAKTSRAVRWRALRRLASAPTRRVSRKSGGARIRGDFVPHDPKTWHCHWQCLREWPTFEQSRSRRGKTSEQRVGDWLPGARDGGEAIATESPLVGDAPDL